MPKVEQTSPEGKVIGNILVSVDMIEEHLHDISKLFPEFSLEWLTGVEKNYDQFLDYLTLAIKTHNANKLSKK